MLIILVKFVNLKNDITKSTLYRKYDNHQEFKIKPMSFTNEYS